MDTDNEEQEQISDSLLKFREKRKWQIALRRYALEKQKNYHYAPYFGLDIETFRKWIEIQFDADLNWDNFGSAWQFDHIVPVVYFNFNKEEDLRLCWNFVNIRVEKTNLNRNRGHRIDVLAAKTYFETLYEHTQYSICLRFVEKIDSIELSQIQSNQNLESFISSNIKYLETLSTFTCYEFQGLNEGRSLQDVIDEKKLFDRFGGYASE